MTVADTDLTKKIVVIYGALRSGSTLMRLILDAHPSISCPGERDFLVDHLSVDGDALVLDVDALSRNRIFQDSVIQLPTTQDGRAAFQEMLVQEVPESGILVLVLHRDLDVLLDLLPTVPVIHLVRDPRDVARSSIGMGWAGNTWYGIEHWLGTEINWDRCSTRFVEGQAYLLRYEDMLSAPEAELTALCQFMGLAYDPAMLTYSETSSYDGLDPKLSYQWKQKQSEREIQHTEFKARDILLARGYELSGIPIKVPTALQRLRLWFDQKSYTWRFRFKRYGYRDPILVFLGNRLSLPGLTKAAQARMDIKTRSHLK